MTFFLGQAKKENMTHKLGHREYLFGEDFAAIECGIFLSFRKILHVYIFVSITNLDFLYILEWFVTFETCAGIQWKEVGKV